MAEKEAALSPADAVLRSFAIHNRIHIYLLNAMPADAWDAPPLVQMEVAQYGESVHHASWGCKG